MHAVIICSEFGPLHTHPGSVAPALIDLGWSMQRGRRDLRDLDDIAVARRAPDMVVVEADDDPMRTQRCVKGLRSHPSLASTPVLVAVTEAGLQALDLALGFDDFILVPVVPAEISARIRKLLGSTATSGPSESLTIDGLLEIDLAGHEVRLAGRRIELTHQEFALLRFFALNRGRVFTRRQLLENAWQRDWERVSRTVDIHVRRLRGKLGDAADLLQTVRHVGYKMQAASATASSARTPSSDARAA